MEGNVRRKMRMSRRERIATALMALLVAVGVWQSYGVLLENRSDVPIRVSPPIPVIP
jgi:hypothetical protein